MRVVEELWARGHPNITAENGKTFEVTMEENLTRRGDCVIAVSASKGAADLSDDFKDLARREDTKITVVVKAGNLEEAAVGWGSPKLTYSHKGDLVARKSSFTCSRTLMTMSDKASADFSRRLIQRLKDPRLKAKITIIAEA